MSDHLSSAAAPNPVGGDPAWLPVDIAASDTAAAGAVGGRRSVKDTPIARLSRGDIPAVIVRGAYVPARRGLGKTSPAARLSAARCTPHPCPGPADGNVESCVE